MKNNQTQQTQKKKKKNREKEKKKARLREGKVDSYLSKKLVKYQWIRCSN